MTQRISDHATNGQPEQPRALVSVVIGDSNSAFRAGIRRALEPAGFVIVAEAEDTTSAVAAAVTTKPDIALIHIDMPGDGMEALAPDARRGPSPTLPVLTPPA